MGVEVRQVAMSGCQKILGPRRRCQKNRTPKGVKRKFTPPPPPWEMFLFHEAIFVFSPKIVKQWSSDKWTKYFQLFYKWLVLGFWGILANYADDSNLSVIWDEVQQVKAVLEMKQWRHLNGLKKITWKWILTSFNVFYIVKPLTQNFVSPFVKSHWAIRHSGHPGDSHKIR